MTVCQLDSLCLFNRKYSLFPSIFISSWEEYFLNRVSQPQENCSWMNSLTELLHFTVLPLSSLYRARKNTITKNQVERVTIIIYFRMNLCQHPKHVIVFCFAVLCCSYSGKTGCQVQTMEEMRRCSRRPFWVV